MDYTILYWAYPTAYQIFSVGCLKLDINDSLLTRIICRDSQIVKTVILDTIYVNLHDMYGLNLQTWVYSRLKNLQVTGPDLFYLDPEDMGVLMCL